MLERRINDSWNGGGVEMLRMWSANADMDKESLLLPPAAAAGSGLDAFSGVTCIVVVVEFMKDNTHLD